MKNLRQRLSQVIEFSRSSQIAFALCTEIIVGVFLTIATLGAFFKLGEDVIDKEIISFDSSIIHFIYHFRTPIVTYFVNKISFLGGDIFLGTAITLTILYLFFNRHKKDALVFSFILFFGIGLNLLLKNMFHRPRPDLIPLVHETSYSFPSGHSMNSFIFYTCLSFFIFRKIKNKKLSIALIIISAIFIFLIGISRIYLGAHYPSDVLAGYIAGLCWFIIVLLFEKTLSFLRLFRDYEYKKGY